VQKQKRQAFARRHIINLDIVNALQAASEI
jgi:hypothetical protein